jgi:hypothetical protein
MCMMASTVNKMKVRDSRESTNYDHYGEIRL